MMQNQKKHEEWGGNHKEDRDFVDRAMAAGMPESAFDVPWDYRDAKQVLEDIRWIEEGY